MFVYIGIVLVGFWYIWKKGALDWGISAPGRGRL
jgi:NADH:ubiquinone oxidoreductase subunit 3 (subunit A)